MNIKRICSGLVVMLVICSALFVFSTEVKSKEVAGAKQKKDMVRILNYLTTDKAIYREGENVYFRVVALEAGSNFPLKGNGLTNLEIKGPKGDIIHRSRAVLSESTAGFAWKIPEGQPGGKYKATASSNGSAKATREFEIRAYQPPRLKTQIEFVRKGYGPGDSVNASINIMRTEGGIPLHATIKVIARVDGEEVFTKEGLSIDDEGNCQASFTLPKEIAVGEGTLTFVIEDGGVVESASKSIPIILQTLEIVFYPEGGELSAGQESRVYLQAKQPNGRPADIEGKIVELNEDVALATVKTIHEGRGRFSFIPEKGKEYVLKLSEPSGIKTTFKLPEVKKYGATIKTLKDIYPYSDKITADIGCSSDKLVKVTLNKREVLLDSQALDLNKEGMATVALDAKEAEGVLMLTVWDCQGAPLAERLVYREPKFGVNVKITPESEAFVPGGKVALNIETTDINGTPVEAVVGLAVTDDAVLEMIEKRQQAPNLPVMVYLENEVEELEDAEVYFDRNNPIAKQAVDLLLGTQGWRRFITVKFDEIEDLHPEAAKRALAKMQPILVSRRYKRAPVRVFAKIVDPAMENEGQAWLEEQVVDEDVETEFDEADVEIEIEVAPDEVMAAGVQLEGERVEVDEAKLGIARRENLNVAFEEEEQLEEIAPEQEMNDADDREFPLFAAKKERVRRPFAPMVTIREYAHKARPNRTPNERVDFTETLYWNAGIRTNPRTGKATVSFDLSDSVTSFRILADAFGNNGALGAGESVVESLEPFYIEPKLPQELTVGDVIELPVALVNSTDKEFGAVTLLTSGDGLEITQSKKIQLAAKERKRAIVRITASKAGKYTLTLNATASGYTDKVIRELTFKSRGFPVSIDNGGLISSEKDISTIIKIPEQFEAASMKAILKVYPTPLANMEEALNALMREPYGCFEQTSSTTYPLVMAQQYFRTHQGIAPDKIKKAQELLDKGYKRLIGFESKDNGYEWFGGNPGHEALTAYGIMEFSDLAKVMPIDNKMLVRTRAWLMSRKDGKGGFKLNERALDGFGRAPIPTTNAYILWALLESGEPASSLETEIQAVKEDAMKTNDTYIIALAVNILYLAGDNQAAKTLANKLVDNVDSNGSIKNATTSITCSGGNSLIIETTSLAILGWLKAKGEYAGAVEKSMKWLFEQCKNGRFGSTQSTVLVLKAINAYDAARAKPTNDGSIQLFIDNQKFGKPISFTKDTKGAISLPDFSAALDSGEHLISAKMSAGSLMPYSIEVKYNTNIPEDSEKCNLELTTKLNNLKIREGESTEGVVTIKVKGNDAPTPIAIIGIPAGLEPRHEQLQELVGEGKIAAYEVIGRTVVLYWRGLRKNTELVIPLSLNARVPGKYTAPASRAYLYYTPEYKDWQSGLEVEITAK